MKSLKTFLTLCAVATFAMGCKDNTQPEVKTVDTATEQAVTPPAMDPNATYAKAEFGIEGMTCAMGCAKTIEKKIAKMEGVKSAVVDFDRHLAMVEYDEAKVTPDALEDAVAAVGDAYKVTDIKNVEEFSVSQQ